MSLLQKIRKYFHFKKDYRKVFCPFFNELDKKLLLIEIIDSSIPKEVTSVYDYLKESNKKKYHSSVHKYEEAEQVIGKHNEEVEMINVNLSSFDKTSIMYNPLSYDENVVRTYYDAAIAIDNYRNIEEKYLVYKKEATFIYKNFDSMIEQRQLYDEKKSIFDELSNCDYYLDYNVTKDYIERDKCINERVKSFTQLFHDFNSFSEIEEFIKEKNLEFIRENKDNKLFDDVNGNSLDDEQRTAVLTDEVSTLVIAGAGSGKTLTICGKVEYLLKEKKVDPNEILILSYSKKSADDLQNKLEKIDKRITVGTFHKIGLDILKEVNNKVLTVEEQYNAIIENYFRVEMKNRHQIMEKILTYYGLYVSAYKSDKKYKAEGDLLEEAKKQSFTTLKYQLVSLTDDLERKETIKKEYVKSFEELAIANWYFINGIEYVYEAPYEIETATADRRKYLPDFYLPDYKIYHEHYGVDENGKASQYEAEEADKYIANMQWKRAIHKDNETTCLETYSYEFKNGVVFEKLESELKEKGVEFHPLTNDEVFKALESVYEGQAFKSFINLIRSFLSLYKARYRDETGLDKLAKSSFCNEYERRRATLFLDIVKDIYLYYKEYLKKEDKIDFDDMILESTKSLESTNNYKFKYILVDEFQDISYSRMLFLKKLIEHGHSKLFAVGDDWQSIYRFSGCDLNIFLKFEQYFGKSAITKISTTYRNSQELQDIAGSFVMSNPNQISKSMVSGKHLAYPIRIMYYSDKKYYAFLDILSEINKIDSKANVLVLGRNNKDFDYISLDDRVFIDSKASSDVKTVVRVKQFPDMNITYSTVHGSKGLEEDYVIIINANDAKLGFPNKMEDDELLDLVLSTNSNYEYSEERRLWYVALTRTRNYTFLLVNNINPSIFVEEIIDKCLVINPNMDVNHQGEVSCPYCKTGRLVLRTNEKTGEVFYGCSNFPYCNYTIGDLKAVKRNKRCPRCGDFMIQHRGQYGVFDGCHNYPRCKHKEK